MTTSIVVDPVTSTQDEPQVTPESKIPEKYRGKTAEELVSILQNVETTVGRQANEIGTLRRFTDTALGFARQATNTQANQPQPTKPQVTSEDLLSNPEGTVTELAKRVADERVSSTERRTANLEAQMAVDRFSRKYPDFESTMGDTKFQEWISGSAYRQKLANAAASRGDFDAADELFGLYYGSKLAKGDEKDDTPAGGLEAARKASLTRKGGSSAAGVAKTGTEGKKLYSRSEMIDLKLRNPDEYDRRYQTEFLPAYKEGRLKP